MELKPNMYVRTYKGIRKIVEVVEDNNYYIDKTYINDFRQEIDCITDSCIIGEPSFNIIDLIEYMDLLVIENKLKDIDNREIYLFNPVRCDGFTTFEDGKHCMIINMDYIIPIENIKIYQALTHEMFESMSYKVGE